MGQHLPTARSETTRRGVGRHLAAILLALAAVLLAALAVRDNPRPVAAAEGPAAAGVVLDEEGSPVVGATIKAGGRNVTSGRDGRFRLPLGRPRFAQITSPDHLPRTQALEPGGRPQIVLTRDKGRSISLRFGGDTMAGRRFYDPRGSRDPLLAAKPTGADHASLLRGVEPLLRDASLSVVNLETPLVEKPPTSSKQPRPRWMHPTKPLSFASSTAMAAGLRASGVGAVSLGNNHVADALGPGLNSTMRALDKAGVTRFGAGRTVEEAWRPAYVRLRQSTVALIGCTTVSGENSPPLYVATKNKGGAAECEPDRLKAAVTAARARSDAVAVMIHGGIEYRRKQTDQVRGYTSLAASSGATVVMNAHPHVAGKLRREGPAVVSDTLGNLLFDQELGATRTSYLARVDLRGGRVVSASADPYMIDDYRPYAATGTLRDGISRASANPSTQLAGSGLTMPVGSPARRSRTLRIEAGIDRLPLGTWLASPNPGVRVGTDLLQGSGEFESQMSPDGVTAPMWTLGKYASVTETAATSGERGLSLARSPASKKDVVANPSHRVPVTPGRRLSLTADVRSSGGGATLELRWYDAMTGSSVRTSTVPIPEGDFTAEGRSVRLDVTVPAGMVAAQPYVRQVPSGDGVTGPITQLDSVRLVAWAAANAAGRRYDIVEPVSGGAAASVKATDDRLP